MPSDERFSIERDSIDTTYLRVGAVFGDFAVGVASRFLFGVALRSKCIRTRTQARAVAPATPPAEMQ